VRRAARVLLAGLLAIGSCFFAWVQWRRAQRVPPPTATRLAELRAERDRLQGVLRAAVLARGEQSLAEAPVAGVMIGIPTSLTSSIVEQVVTGLFGETTLTLKNLKVHKEGKVRAKMLVRKRTLGEFVLDVNIHQVQGILKPGKPTLVFGTSTVDLTLPVRLAEGKGSAELRFQWDSKGLAANTVCGDVDVTREVGGGVVPKDYEVSGSFRITAVGNAIRLEPRFPELAVRIFVDPSDQAWGIVDGVVKEQRKGCEIALTKVDIKEKLGGILGKGFNVKIPQKIFKPIKLPAGVKQSLKVQGIQMALEARPTGLLVTPDRLWYGADLNFRSSRPAAKP
jgi:hypothetical protein